MRTTFSQEKCIQWQEAALQIWNTKLRNRLTGIKNYLDHGVLNKVSCVTRGRFFSVSTVWEMFSRRLWKKSLLSQTNWRFRVANRICCQLNIIFSWKDTVSLFSRCNIIHSISYSVQSTTYTVGHPWPPILLIQQIVFLQWKRRRVSSP